MPLDPSQFFGLPPCEFEKADVLILPWPLEKTVSYITGTRTGPQAILTASPQVELFDEETLIDFAEGPKLHTLPAIEVGAEVDPEDISRHLEDVARLVRPLRNRFLLTLGGEHSLTYGIVTGLVEDLSDVTIVQVDAHADLIDRLGGRRWSHGTVMRRLWERGCRLIQIGIRSLSRSEYEVIRTGDRITTFFAHDMADRWESILDLLRGLTGKVYLSFDVDGLDPSIVPSTGTPQPNGLDWLQAMQVVKAVAHARGCEWIGADVVELIASPNPPGCDCTVARLVMKMLAYRAAR